MWPGVLGYAEVEGYFFVFVRPAEGHRTADLERRHSLADSWELAEVYGAGALRDSSSLGEDARCARTVARRARAVEWCHDG